MPFDNPMMGSQSETNLLSILINIAFGFVAGLIFLFGFHEVIAYGTKLAGDILKTTGYGQQMGAYGFATMAAPYVILAPIAGMVVKQLSSVRSFKSFAYFALAVAAGCGAAYGTQGYFATLL